MAEEVEKRKVTMTSVFLLPDGKTGKHEATDYVPVDMLDAYVADAQTRWQHVEVGKKNDHGPGGPKGKTAKLKFEE